MRALKSLLLLFSLSSLLISSCNSYTPVITPTQISISTSNEIAILTFTPTPEPTNIKTPTHTPTIAPANTPIPTPSDEPGLIVTLGEKVSGPWHSGIPVFSPDGQIIALASSRIRFWDFHTHKLIRELENPYPAEGCHPSNAKFSSDGTLFAASITGCWEGENVIGHLLIWNLSTGDLIQEWTQEYAKMPPTSPTSTEYFIPVYAMAFIPNSTKLIFANGNALEIRNVMKNEESDILKLGPKMFASQISVSPDGRLAYIIMSWEKSNDFPAFWTEQHKFQIWNINTHAMLREVKYPEGWVNLSLELLDTRLVQVDFEKSASQILNLETDNVRDIPFRKGWRYYNSDGSLMIYARLFGFYDNEQAIELWKTDNWRNIYTFMPDFGTNWTYGMHEIAFSPDNTTLAIEHQEQVSLWDISPIVQP